MIDAGIRRTFQVALAIAAAAFVVLVANFVQEGWLSSEPFFRHDTGREFTIRCFESDLPADTFWVTFSDEGRTALVRFRDRDAELTFQRGGFVRDVYIGDGLVLTIDPEIYMDGYRGRRIGPCDRYEF